MLGWKAADATNAITVKMHIDDIASAEWSQLKAGCGGESNVYSLRCTALVWSLRP